MVFESLVADVLNRFLGDYVENLDRSQLKIGIWGGDVVLQNLLLKDNALADLNLPIKTVAGRLGRLVLKIPWKSLYTSPVVATIENLELLVVPNSDAKYDPAKEEKAKKEAKKKELQRIEDAKRQEAEKNKSDQSQDSFTEKLVSQIIKNLQVKVADIHIRYEDSFTNPRRPFSFGITLHNLLFETTSKEWRIGTADDSEKFIYKLISLDSLSFYWNSNQTLYSKLPSSELQKKLQEDIATSQLKPNNIMYVLGPINSTAKLQLNQKPELDGSDYKIPKILLTVEMQEIALSLSKFQYQDIMELLQSLERIAAASLYHQYHPTVPLKENPKVWWKFAYTCVVENGVRRKKKDWSWEHMKKHRYNFHHYKEIYRDKLQNKKLSENIKKEIENLEDLLDVLNITLARKQAEVEYSRLGLKTKSDESYTGWISSWLPWNKEKKSSEESGLVKKFEEAMTLDEKAKLYEAIGYQENTAPTVYPKTFVENKFHFYLHNLTIKVKDDSLSKISDEVMIFSMSKVKSDIEMRPSAQAMKLKAEVGGLAVFGCKNEAVRPTIIQSLTESDAKPVSLLKVLFETNPLGENCDQKIRVHVQPIEIIYHAGTINQLAEVFKPPESVALSGLQEAAKSSLKDFNELSATGLQHAISQQKVLNLDINIQSTHVIIPENGLFTPTSHYLVADLGSLKMCSIAKNPDAPSLAKLCRVGSTESEKLQEMMIQSYEKFYIGLSGMQILLACPGDVWQTARGCSSSIHLLHPTNINIELQKCCIMDDPRLPKMKVKGCLPSLLLVLSDSKLLQLATVVLSIPTPKGNDQVEIMETHSEIRPLPARSVNVDIKRLATEDLSKNENVSTIQSSNVQVTDVELIFEIEKFGLTVTQQHDDQKDLFNFAILGLGIAMSQRPYDLSVQMYVGGLTLEAPRYPGLSGGPLYIISTPMTEGSTEKLFSVSYRNVNKRAPDFSSTYESVEQLIQVKFSKLNVVLHQEVILETISLANSIQAKVEEIKKRVQPEPEGSVGLRRRHSSALSSVYELAKATTRTHHSKRVQMDEIINVQLVAEMESFSVAVCTVAKPITDINIKGLQTAVTVQPSKTSVAARLKTVVIHDSSNDACYKKILSFDEDDAFDVKLINFNNATAGPKLDLNAVDTSVSASVGGIQLIFLNRFVAEIMDFVNHFQMAKEKVIEASSAAAQAAKQNMQNVYQKASRIKLSFKMKAPVIIVPQNSQSNNALVADLGFLKLNNQFTSEGLSDKQPIFDNIEIGLENLKLSRAVVNPVSGSVVSECLLLEPITFTLKLRRNLTINWYKGAPEVDVVGKIAAISFLMTQEDFSVLMSVLNENLAEGQQYGSSADKDDGQTEDEIALTAIDVLVEEDETEQVAVFKKATFSFEMESFALQLFSGSSYLDPHEPMKRLGHPLAKFELTLLAVSGEMLSDNSLWTKIVLIKCLLNDTRSASTPGRITRLLEVTDAENQKMLDVNFSRDASGITHLDVTVSSITLVLCVEYMMMLASFFTEGMAAKPDQSSITPVKGALAKKEKPKPSLPPTSETTVIFNLKKPDIIIVENTDDIDSCGIIFNNEIKLTLKITPELQNMMVTIANLQLITCCYNPEKRASTMTEILSPCHVSVTSNTPVGEGMRLDVNVTDVIIHVTPSTIQLLSSIGSSFATKPVEVEKSDITETKDYLELWQEKSLFENEFWFTKTEEATEATESLSVDMFQDDLPESNVKGEQMILEIKTIILTIETGEGLRTIPMITWESSFTGEIKDWSSRLYVGCSFNMEVAYYNEKMAVFEPLIEPVEIVKERRPWELIVELKKNEPESPAVLPDDEIDEVQFAPAALSLNVISQDILELTITKSALEVFTNLGKAFSEAVSNNILLKKELPLCPYTVKNETGLPISLILKDQDFEVNDTSSENIEEVVLEVGTSVPLVLKHDLNLSKKSLIKHQDLKEERNLMIKIDQMGILRPLAVTKADKRYYPLPQRTYPGDQWGLVTEVTSKYGYKTVTLRSSVQIINHISVPVEVYYMTEGGNEVNFCGQVEPHGSLNLPLHAVYTKTNEIFLRPKYNGYTVSVVPFIWKELQKNPNVRKVLQCNPRESGGQPFFMNVIGEIEQVYYENSSRKTITSTCYKINLHPTVVLCNMLPYNITYSFTGVSDENILEEGHSKELLTAELNVTEINLKIANYMNQDWYCKKKLMAQMEEVWTFEAKGQIKQTLDLGMYLACDSGFLRMCLYCPFWMMNKTGLELHYRRTRKAERSSSLGSPAKNEDPCCVITHAPSMNFPVMFSFRPKVFFSKKKASLKVENSEWSDKFSLDTVGSSGTVKCCNKSGSSYEVGVQIRLSNLGFSKIVIFTPFYLIVNNASYDIECFETASATEEWILLPAGQCSPFWPKYCTKKKELILRVVSTPENTKPFSYEQGHTTLLKLNNSKGGLCIECQLTEASTIITVNEYVNGSAPVHLVNHCTSTSLSFSQSGLKEIHKLNPKSHVFYTWEDPNGLRELIWFASQKGKMKNSLVMDGIGEYETDSNEIIYWVSFLDDTQRVLMFTDDLALATGAQCANEFETVEQEILVSLQGIGLSLIDDSIRQEVVYIALASSGIIWESCKVNSRRYRPFNVKECLMLETAYQKYLNEIKLKKKTKKRVVLDKLEVDFEAEMLYKPNQRKIRRIYQPGLWFQYKTSPHQLQLHAKFNRLQIDNQLNDCVFPTVVAPVPLPKSVAADTVPKPFTEACIILRKSEHSSVQQFKYFKVLVQEFHVKLDQSFINALINLFSRADPAENKKLELFDQDKKVAQMDLKELTAITSSQEQKNFYDILHFSPLKVHVSFSMQGSGVSDDPKQPTAIHSDFLNLLLQSVGVTLTEIQDVVFKLAFFEKQHVFLTQKQLTADAVRHYTAQAIKQMYVLVLGLDVIGNPFGLVMGLGKGVEDLFYEPFQGAVQGPEEFAEGLALGIKSLFGHAVGGAAGAVSRITGTLGKGVAALTMDAEYQRKRREALNRRPANLQEGLARSGKGLVMGVFDGVTGVFVKPIEGAKEEGVEGFFKGVGKGVVGLVTRPTSGVIDFASGSLDAVKRVADVSEEVHRLRPPRYFQSDGIVRPYNKYEAEGNKLLKELEKGKFALTDHYLAHVVVTQDGKAVFVVTDKRVIMISKGDIFGQWNCEWNHTWDEIKELPRVTDKGLEIPLKETKKKVLGFFSSSHSAKIIEIKDREVATWLLNKIESAMKRSM